MKLNQIEFQDWRCFTGNQTIRFATDHGKSVTALWGANSSGKTTILNGILWALWGTLTEDFQNPDHLVSEIALSSAGEGETLSAYVEVKFEHGGKRYTMKRSCSERKSDSTISDGLETYARLTIVDESGETFIHLDSVAFSMIDQILPKVLATYFFFNGEKFRLQVQSAQGEKTFADAVRQVIGLTKYERAIRHINKAKHELDVRISNSEKSDELDKLINLKNQAEHKRVGFVDRIENLDDEFGILKNRFDEIAIEQSKFHEIREVILARQGVETDLKTRKSNLANLQETRTDLLGDLYSLYVLMGVEGEVRGLAENHRRQKHIPADFKKSFIDDLLASGSCICGCELVQGTDPYRKLIARLKEGALEGTEESWTMLSVELGTVNNRYEFKRSQFEELNGKIYSEDEAIQNLLEKLSNYDESILGVAAIDEARTAIVDLESERKDNVAKQIELTQQKERNAERLSECNKSIADYDKEIGKIEPKNEEAKLDSLRRRYLSLAQAHLEKEFLELKESLRDELEMSITTIFRSLSNSAYFAELDSDFSLKLCSKDDSGVVREVALGTGETQLKYYSFIAALSKLNYENSVNSESIHQSFPIMIDAPFSYLDSSLSERVALSLPTMTHQVIFLNLKKELSTMIQSEVCAAVGAVNVLTFFANKKENYVNENIDLPQGVVSYVVAQENGPRYTKINTVNV
jgi:DNA sulfur modification protein DndD